MDPVDDAAAQVLVVGAGPVGLGAALFLARHGAPPRVVERRRERSLRSKALAVNPRTLELLEPTGVTARMLELGLPVRGLRVHRGGRVVAEVSFEGVHPSYPFMLALTQATTERLLAEAFGDAGGAVERGTELTSCRAADDGTMEAVLAREEEEGEPETARVPRLLAADGAHSTVREALGVPFAGSALPHEWHLADVPLLTDLAPDRAHLVLAGDGTFRFMLRVVGDAPDGGLHARTAPPADAAREHPAAPHVAPGAPALWRVVSPVPDPHPPVGECAGPAVWTSRFPVHHRLAATFHRDGAFLAGDAAHVHSPLGARGMNLGLEDAWVFAELAHAGRLDEYGPRRRGVDRSVVRRVERLSRLASTRVEPVRRLRPWVFPAALRLPFVGGVLRRTVTGQDHDVIV